MPKFIFNRLVRDNLRHAYAELGQKAVYKKLSKREHISELKRKVIEEVKEIPEDGPISELIEEIADLQQVIDDMKKLIGISDEQVDVAKKQKFDKKGGFIEGTFVETLELEENDEWVEYYRRKPDVHKEVK